MKLFWLIINISSILACSYAGYLSFQTHDYAVVSSDLFLVLVNLFFLKIMITEWNDL